MLSLFIVCGFISSVKADTRVVICDTCTSSTDARNIAYESVFVPVSQHNPNDPPGDITVDDQFHETLAIVNLNSEVVYTFQMIVTVGANYINKEAWQINNAPELIQAINAYHTFKDEISQFGELSYSAIPVHLSSSSTPIGGAPISSSYTCTIDKLKGYPVAPSVANTVSDLKNNIDTQRAVAEMLRGTITAGSLGYITEPVKNFVAKILKLRPVPITTTFNDGSFVQWRVLDLRGTIPVKMLPDTAHDSDCNKVDLNDDLGVFSNYGGGRYENLESLPPSSPVFVAVQVCITSYTGSRGGYVPQLVCWYETGV